MTQSSSSASPEPVKPSQPLEPLNIQSQKGDYAASSGFAKMLGPSATPEQVQKAMMQAVNFIIMDLKREEKKAKEAAKHMKDVIEGKDQ